MLSRDEVLNLITTTKQPEKGIDLIFHQNVESKSYILKSKLDDSLKFRLDLSQHKKVSLKLSCHHRDGSNIGLIRIDYNGPRHRNPKIISTEVPTFLHRYSGIEIPPRESHIHIYVEGEGLDLAMPLFDFSNLSEEERDGILVSKIDINNNNDKVDAFRSFADIINIEAKISAIGGLISN